MDPQIASRIAAPGPLLRNFGNEFRRQHCSAGFQPAVSRISNPPGLQLVTDLPTRTRRYGRWETCVSSLHFPHALSDHNSGRFVKVCALLILLLGLVVVGTGF